MRERRLRGDLEDRLAKQERDGEGSEEEAREEVEQAKGEWDGKHVDTK